MGTGPGHGVPGFLEGFARAGGGGRQGDRTWPGSGAGRAEPWGRGPLPPPSLSAPGATSAPCLIFIFPAIFYIRIMPKDKEPLRSTPKILVSMGGGRQGWGSQGWAGDPVALAVPDLLPCPRRLPASPSSGCSSWS